MRYLSYALYPLVIGYAIYALYYQTHKVGQCRAGRAGPRGGQVKHAPPRREVS